MRTVVSLLVLLATVGCGASPQSLPSEQPAEQAQFPPPSTGTLEGYGISLRAPSGWNGRLARGILEVASVPLDPERFGTLDPLPADGVLIALYEREPDDPDFFTPVALPLQIRPGQAAPDGSDARELVPAHHDVVKRALAVGGRAFLLRAEFGTRPAPRALIASANELLSTLAIAPGDHFPGVVQPAAFLEATGWHTGSSGPHESRPDGDWTESWASTIPSRGEAYATLGALPEGGSSSSSGSPAQASGHRPRPIRTFRPMNRRTGWRTSSFTRAGRGRSETRPSTASGRAGAGSTTSTCASTSAEWIQATPCWHRPRPSSIVFGSPTGVRGSWNRQPGRSLDWEA